MMTIDIDYKLQFGDQHKKKLTELYLGSVNFTWPYAVVDYKINCTEELPLSPIEKAVVGLLSIEKLLTFDEIAEILGFNVIDKQEINRYRDLAEYEIMVENISSMTKTGMIEEVNNHRGYKLTDIGRQYALKNTKYHNAIGKPITLYFDLCSGDMKYAKSVFQNRSLEMIDYECNLDFCNETLINRIACYQLPELSRTKVSVFSNAIVEKVAYYNIPLIAGIVYDFVADTFRIIVRDEVSGSEYFTNRVNKSEELRQKIKNKFINTLKPTNRASDAKQELYEKLACRFQTEADLLFQKNEQQGIEKISEYYNETSLIETANFWIKIEDIVGYDSQEVWISGYSLNKYLLRKINRLAEARKNTLFFILLDHPDSCITEKLEKLNNFYIINYDLEKPLILIKKQHHSFSFHPSEYYLHQNGVAYAIEVLIRDDFYYPDRQMYNCFKSMFIHEHLKQMVWEYDLFLKKEFNPSLCSIETIEKSDERLLYFKDWINETELYEEKNSNDNKFSLIRLLSIHYNYALAFKKQKYEELKAKHRALINEKLKEISIEISRGFINSTEELDYIREKLDAIEKECNSCYDNELSEIKNLQQEINKRECYLRDFVLPKQFIIDSSVFCDFPDIIYHIDPKHQIILSAKVIEELETLKLRLLDDKLINVNKAIENICQELAKQSNVVTAKAKLKLLPVDYPKWWPDSFILSIALSFKSNNHMLLSTNNELIAKAKALGISATVAREYHIDEKFDKLYKIKNLPVNIHDKTPINITLLISAYNAVLNPRCESVVLSLYNESLVRTIPGFSCKKYGYNKFMKFLNAMPDIFELGSHDDGIPWVKIKTETL